MLEPVEPDCRVHSEYRHERHAGLGLLDPLLLDREMAGGHVIVAVRIRIAGEPAMVRSDLTRSHEVEPQSEGENTLRSRKHRELHASDTAVLLILGQAADSADVSVETDHRFVEVDLNEGDVETATGPCMALERGDDEAAQAEAHRVMLLLLLRELVEDVLDVLLVLNRERARWRDVGENAALLTVRSTKLGREVILLLIGERKLVLVQIRKTTHLDELLELVVLGVVFLVLGLEALDLLVDASDLLPDLGHLLLERRNARLEILEKLLECIESFALKLVLTLQIVDVLHDVVHDLLKLGMGDEVTLGSRVHCLHDLVDALMEALERIHDLTHGHATAVEFELDAAHVVEPVGVLLRKLKAVVLLLPALGLLVVHDRIRLRLLAVRLLLAVLIGAVGVAVAVVVQSVVADLLARVRDHCLALLPAVVADLEALIALGKIALALLGESVRVVDIAAREGRADALLFGRGTCLGHGSHENDHREHGAHQGVGTVGHDDLLSLSVGC